jgi:hypothetical protein
MHGAKLAASALQAEIKPLRNIGVRIFSEIKPDGLRFINAQDFDGPGIELVTNFDGHKMVKKTRCAGCATVRPRPKSELSIEADSILARERGIFQRDAYARRSFIDALD